MSTLRSSIFTPVVTGARCAVFIKRIASGDVNEAPSVAEARLDAFHGFVAKQRLSYADFQVWVASRPDQLAGHAFVVALPAGHSVANLLTWLVTNATISLSTFALFGQDTQMYADLLSAAYITLFRDYSAIGGIYDPESGNGMVGAAAVLRWPGPGALVP